MLNAFLQRIKNGESVSFAETQNIINTYYNYQATTFSNGLIDPLLNQAGSNEGSCKIFAFAQLHQLNQQETLSLFGEYYQDVLLNPEATNHNNIRNFLRDGWAGITYQGTALSPR